MSYQIVICVCVCVCKITLEFTLPPSKSYLILVRDFSKPHYISQQNIYKTRKKKSVEVTYYSEKEKV